MKTVEYLTAVLYGTFTPPNVPSRRFIAGKPDDPRSRVEDYTATKSGTKILTYLAEYAGAWFTKTEISDDLGIPAVTVGKNLLDLVNHRMVEVKRRPIPGRPAPYVYRMPV